MGDLHLQLALLEAAIAAAKKNAHGPAARRAHALFFIRAAGHQYAQQRKYRMAWLCNQLGMEARRSDTLMHLLENLRTRSAIEMGSYVGPHCNTGPTGTLLDGCQESAQVGAQLGTVKDYPTTDRRARVYDAPTG